MKINEGKLDRIIRVGLGVVLIALAIILYFVLNAPTNWILLIVLLVIGLISLVTGLTGFCGIYAICKISTVKKE